MHEDFIYRKKVFIFAIQITKSNCNILKIKDF